VLENCPPEVIVNGLLTQSEKDSMIKYLIGYQKTGMDWEICRKKIPTDLLEKWANVLRECRLNGFMAPKVQSEKLIWKQIFGFKRNYKNADKCTLCPRNFIAGDCKGGSKHKFGTILFRPCWE
jgi:hypothetical protein